MFKFSFIKYFRLIQKVGLLSSLIFFLWQCTSSKDSESTDNAVLDSIKIEEKGSAIDVTSTDNLMKSVFYTTTDIERNTFLDQPLATVLEKETAVVSDSASNFKTFSTYFNDSDEEFVDVQYYNDGKNVTMVKYDVYLNNVNTVAEFYKKIVAEFTKKYGKGTAAEKATSWVLPNNQKVTAKDVSVKLAPGLQITYSKIGDSAPIE